jgi:mono/diheme cytochrome c family protein
MRTSSLLTLCLSVVVIVACSRSASTTPEPTSTPSATTGTGAAARAALPTGVTPQMVALGDSLFNNGACQRCHSKGGVGGQNGPVLTDNQWIHIDGSYDAIVRVVTTGVPKAAVKDSTRRFGMNPRGGPMNLTDDQVRAVAAYVFSISRR